MTRNRTDSMRIIGRGSEATIYYDDREQRAVKHFDRAPIRIARSKAEREFGRLQQAHAKAAASTHVRVPEPGTLSDQRAAFSMERIESASLLDGLAKGTIRGDQTRHMAALVAEGIVLFKDILADCTLDHVHPNPDGTVTFLDFGNGSEDENGIEPAGPLAAFIEVAGSTLYECSRPGRYRGLAELDECARFLGLLTLELGLTWNSGLERKIWHSFAGRGLERGALRYIWYRAAGGYNSRRMFRLIRHMMPSSALPDMDTVFSFVWDFPAEDMALTNGVHKVVDGLMAALVPKGVHPVLLTLGDQNRVLHRNGYTIEVHASRGHRIPDSLVERIATEGLAGLTILNGTFNTLNTRLGRRLADRGLPYVIQPHTIMDDAFFSVSPIKKRVWWWLFERRFLSEARTILSYSRDQESMLRRLGVRTSVITTMNGICSATDELPDLPDTASSTDSPTRFHFFGRISRDTKGLDLLIEATQRVSADHRLEVTIQGPDQGDREGLEREVAQRGLSSVIRFLGPVSSPDPIHIMSKYDVCILPSRYEGFPTAAVEALIAGRPLVCTRAGALAQHLEDADVATVVDANVDSIEQGMRLVIEGRDNWPAMADNARKWALDHLDWDPIASDMLHQLAVLKPEDA